MTSESAERGTFLIADLSGYTEYLVRAEIRQASAIVADLVGRIAESVGVSFVVDRVEGDAVVTHAPEGSVDGTGVLDTIDGTYAEFRHRALAVHQATSCGCEACGLVPNLDLKFVVHHGEYVEYPVAGRLELSGRDVIIAHRLLKNALGRSGPDSGYALVTAAVVEALGLSEVVESGIRHVEVFDHLGEVETWVIDLYRRWADLPRWSPPAEPVVVEQADVASDPAALWGLLAPGRSEACVTGRLDQLADVVEWRPYERFAVGVKQDGIGLIHAATFEPVEAGTRATLFWYASEVLPDAVVDRLRGETVTALGQAFAAISGRAAS